MSPDQRRLVIVAADGVGRRRERDPDRLHLLGAHCLGAHCVGLGFSGMSRRYSIGSLDEARAYLAHPVLGQRLRECVGLVMDIPDATAEQVFGSLDAMKFRSCLTLFDLAGGDDLFRLALEQYYRGERDEVTVRMLAQT